VASLAELIDQGIKAFTRGLHADAERHWREALELDPANERVRGYLKQLKPGQVAGRPEAAPPRKPAPKAPAAPPAPAAAPAPVRAAAPAPRASAPAPAPGPRAAAPAPAAAQAKPVGSAAPATPAQDFAPSPWDDGPALQATIVLESEGGLDLSAISEKSDLRSLVPEPATTPVPRPAAPKTDVDVWMEGARELFALGDFSGSLEMIEKILKIDGGHAEARAYLRQNESTLVSMYESKLGSLTNVPRLAIKPEEVMWLNLDHRAGFLLAQVDGSVNFEELFALSGLPRLDTAKILAQLLADGVIRGGAQ
jgi:tetratricopeptide (TPR) repeat protein